ncbi:ATP-binding cassette domain-containing protein, partial [Clostridium perfringens]|uniref:ATP-binding cassette domain-containing protein n=1 Tax=Clostridium perfringens TaxID=1502 RepID=UPI002AC6A4F4
MSYIEIRDEYKRYKVGENIVVANNGIDFSIEKGEFVIILGPSGAGKTTVLNILGGMETCDEGKIIIDDVDISKFNNKQLTSYRRYD